MDTQEAFLTVFGDMRVAELIVYACAVGGVIFVLNKAYDWLRGHIKKADAKESAIKNTQFIEENYEKWHGESKDLRAEFRRDIDKNTKDIKGLMSMKDDMAAVKVALQVLLRSNIIAMYNKYHDKGYMPIGEREEFTKAYDAYTGLGGNGVAHGLYEKAQEWPTDPDEREIANG